MGTAGPCAARVIAVFGFGLLAGFACGHDWSEPAGGDGEAGTEEAGALDVPPDRPDDATGREGDEAGTPDSLPDVSTDDASPPDVGVDDASRPDDAFRETDAADDAAREDFRWRDDRGDVDVRDDYAGWDGSEGSSDGGGGDGSNKAGCDPLVCFISCGGACAVDGTCVCASPGS